MSYLDDREKRDRRSAEEAKLQRAAVEQMGADIQAIMRSPSGRRLVHRFIQAMGVDASPFNGNGATMALAVGKQDAGRWWLELIRDFCPEQEVVMRNEARAAEKADAAIIERAATGRGE